MKVGLVCPYSLDVAGGVQTQVRAIASELRDKGDEALVVGPGVGLAPKGEVRLGRAVPSPGNGSVARLLLSPSKQSAFNRHVSGCDVLHVHEPSMPALGWWAARSPIPQIHTFHADVAPIRGTVGRRLLAVLPDPSARTAVSEVAAANWRGKIEIIPNVIRPVETAAKIAGRVVCIGRDEPRKGIATLKAAWPAVVGALPDAQLHLTIDGPESAQVHHLGALDDLSKDHLVASAQVAVAPNLFGESFGLVVGEALAAGTALVMSDLPAFRAVAGTAAVAVPAGDPSAFATAIIALLEDSEERSRRVAEGRLVVQRFEPRTVVPKYRALYESALSKRHR